MDALACIVGVGESDCGVLPQRTVWEFYQQAARAAVADAGLCKDDIDGLFSCGDEWTHPLQLAEYLGLQPAFVDSTQVGGSSGEFFVEHAVAALRAGLCTVALLVHAGATHSERGRPSAHGGRGPAQYESPFGLTLVGRYALVARRHMHEFGTTSRQLAAVAVAANRWAQLNPRALHHGKPLSIDDVLRTRMIADPLRRGDCCVRSDGGGALVLTTSERARNLRRKPIGVLGTGETISHLQVSQWPDLTDMIATRSAGRAFEQAGIAAQDVDVLQLDDAFTIMVLLSLEALGFCARGESGPLAVSGALDPGGRLPLNTDGGGLAAHHPGARGLLRLIEATRQLRGDCGLRQVANARIAVCNGIGGYFSACGTVVLGA